MRTVANEASFLSSAKLKSLYTFRYPTQSIMQFFLNVLPEMFGYSETVVFRTNCSLSRWLGDGKGGIVYADTKELSEVDSSQTRHELLGNC